MKIPFIAILEFGGTVMRDIRLANRFPTSFSTLALATSVALSAVFCARVSTARRSLAFPTSGDAAGCAAVAIPAVTSPTYPHARLATRAVEHPGILHDLAPGACTRSPV